VRDYLHLPEGWTSFILLLLLLLTMAVMFAVGGLAEGLYILPPVVLAAILLGMIITCSRLPGPVAHPLGLALGAVCCFLAVSLTVPIPPWRQFAGSGWQQDILYKGQMIAERLAAWLATAQQGETSVDPLPFVAQMAALSWLMSFYAVWSLFRSHWVWGAILPAGVTIFIGVYYGPPRLMTFFVAYLLLALMLIVRAHIYQREHDWRQRHVRYDPGVTLEFLRDGLLISCLVLGLVWIIPHPQMDLRAGRFWSALEGPWSRVQREFNRLFAALSYREPSGLLTFGPTLALGGPISLSTDPVLQVRAPEGHYWRALVLDRYTGNAWADTTPSTLLSMDSGADLSSASAYASRKAITETVTLLRNDQRLLFVAADPLRIDFPTRVQALPIPGGQEVSSIYARFALDRGEGYVAVSSVSTADVESLRQAGRSYPAWVTDRYLQLPPGLPARVRHLARQVTAGEATPYDQAVAIQYYLRQFKYNPAVQAPPAGQDAVDYFLFDSQQGYCTYYASAMVLMCRVLGIPARLAQGYAAGEYIPEQKAFLVRERDAHAWPEVYFPGYGWIEFEPTPSQSLFVRPAGTEAFLPGTGPLDIPGAEPGPGAMLTPTAPGAGPANPEAARQGRRRQWGLGLAVGGILLAGAGAFGWGLRRRWLATPPAQRLYLRLTWLAAPLGIELPSEQTPLELGRTLGNALGPQGQETAAEITRLYTRERFGARTVASEELSAAAAAWRRLVPLALLQGIRRRMHLNRE